MLKKIIFTFYILFTAIALAQVGGETTYQFLNFVPSPRQAALGGKVFTNVDYDVTQGLFNPATINADMNKQLALNYSILGAVGYGTMAYAREFGENKRMFHFGAIFRSFGTFDGRDENGADTGDFNASDVAISVSHALRLHTTDFYLGTAGKIISSNYEQYNSFGVALDLSLLYFNPEESKFITSLVIRNFGLQLSTYEDVKQNLPLEIALGFSNRLEHVPIRWHLTLENLQKWPIASSNPARVTSDLEGEQTQEKVGVLAQVVRRTIIGAEFFPEKGFNIRLGYSFRRGEELSIINQRNFSGLSLGFSIRMKKLRFSYTYAKYASAANPNFFGLQIDLD